MPRYLILPEVPLDELRSGGQRAERQRVFFFGGVSREDIARWRRGVMNDDVHRTSDGVADLLHRVTGSEPVHAAAFGEQVRDQNDGPAHVLQRLTDAVDEKNRHEAGVKAAGPDEHGVERADGPRDRRVNLRRRLQPDAFDKLAAALSAIDFHFSARLDAIAVLGAHARTLDADGPDMARASEQRSQAVDRRQKIAA